jgi:hypothetical protein
VAALTVGGVDISVSRDDVVTDYEEIGGDRVRMRNATMREIAPTRKRQLHCQTRLLTSAEESTQRTALIGTPPITCSGDILGGSVSCHVQLLGSDRVGTVSGVRFRLRFIVFER